MARRLVYLATGGCLAGTALFAAAWSEARLAFAVLGVALIMGSWWLTRRLPARPVSVRELLAFGIAMLDGGLALALLIPSTRVMCDCPPPPGATDGWTCNCPVDHHMVLRTALVLGSIAVATALAVAARRRAYLRPQPRDHQVTFANLAC